MIPCLFYLVHSAVTSDSPGERKMYTNMRRRYYWQRIALDYIQHVRNFEHCTRERIQILQYAYPFRLFPQSGALEEVAIDIMGPFQKYACCHTNLLVITDRFTKLMKTVPMLSKQLKAWNVARSFSNHTVFCYAPPDILLSYNGSPLNSNFSNGLHHSRCV